jgi:membrane protease YdiL (CAAX protease family)
MTIFDDDFSKPPEQNVEPPAAAPEATVSASNESSVAALGGDPLSNAVPAVVQYSQRAEVPEDLRISWSWVHLLCFILFAFASLIVVQTGFAIHYAPHKQIPQKELEQYLFSIPQFIVGSNVVWFGVVLLFLYVTLSVLPSAPFWRTLGWRKFSSTPEAIHSKLPTKPWLYLLGGCGLSLITAAAGSRVHAPDNMPIEELLKSRVGAMLMMSMAVLVAPLVEETIFRGYLYPVLVRIISGAARFTAADSARATRINVLGSASVAVIHFAILHRWRVALMWGIISLLFLAVVNFLIDRFVGTDPQHAIRAGVSTSILTTGLLFGLLHGAQLAWTWGIVSLLIFVGITFTYVRARTGTVFASYLMHLGYNGLIAFATIVGTHGFTKMPPHP